MIIHLFGPDTYRSQQRLHQLRDAFREKHDPSGLGSVMLDGQSMAQEELRNAVSTSGFFSAMKFIGINHYELQQATINIETLRSIVEPLAESKEVVIVVREVPAKSTAGKSRKPAGRAKTKSPIAGATFESFKELSEPEVRKWIQQYATKLGGTFEPEAASQLVAWYGKDLWRISNEVSKLVAFAGDDTVSTEAVEKLVQTPEQSDVFALTDALGQRQTAQALRFLEQELAAGTHPLALVSLLANHIRRLLMVQVALEAGQSRTTLAKNLAAHPYVIQKAVAQSKHFSLQQLQRWHRQLLSIDLTLKSTTVDAAALLNVLIVRG